MRKLSCYLNLDPSRLGEQQDKMPTDVHPVRTRVGSPALTATSEARGP